MDSMPRRKLTRLNPSQRVRRLEVGVERRARTRTRLMEAAYRLFATHGSDAPSIHDVIAEADVSRGSFYNHFETRDDLFRAVADEVASSINAMLQAQLSDIDDPATHIGLSFRMFLHFAVTEQTRGWILLRMMPLVGPLNRDMRTLIQHDFEQAIAKKRFRTTSVNFAVDLGMGMLITTIRRLLTEGGGDRHIDQTAADLLVALGLPAAEARAIAHSPIDYRSIGAITGGGRAGGPALKPAQPRRDSR